MLDLAGAAVKPGVTTDDIDRVCHEATIVRGAYPSPLNYHGFPKRWDTHTHEKINLGTAVGLSSNHRVVITAERLSYKKKKQLRRDK